MDEVDEITLLHVTAGAIFSVGVTVGIELNPTVTDFLRFGMS